MVGRGYEGARAQMDGPRRWPTGGAARCVRDEAMEVDHEPFPGGRVLAQRCPVRMRRGKTRNLSGVWRGLTPLVARPEPCRIVPVTGLALPPWRRSQVGGRSQGQNPRATLDMLGTFYQKRGRMSTRNFIRDTWPHWHGARRREVLPRITRSRIHLGDRDRAHGTNTGQGRLRKGHSYARTQPCFDRIPRSQSAPRIHWNTIFPSARIR